MNRIMLVAGRDFRQIVGTRAFKITLLAVPLMLAISVAATSLIRPPATSAYVVAGPGAGFGATLERRLELDYQRQVMRELSAYARRWKAAPPGNGMGDEAAVARFKSAGGIEGAVARMNLPAGTPAFKPSAPPYVRVAVPATVPVDQGAQAFADAIAPYLANDIQTPQGKRPLAVAAFIPASGPVALWTNGRNSNTLVATIQEESNRQARIAQLAAGGIGAAAASRIESLEAPVMVVPPAAGGGRSQMLVRSLVPLALVYLLLLAAMITGGMMLQGVIEERSNRLLEAVLACVEPRELMLGKLIGLGGVGLTIIIAWIGCALIAAFAIQGAVADYLQPSLAALNQPWMIPVLAFYFFFGYLMLAMVYLTVGSLSNSMQDAQSYLMPITMGVMLPVILIMNSTIQNPNGLLPTVMSWIPVYTPFAMLARLGSGVSVMELIGTGVLLAGFVALELVFLGRVFRASLLNTGQPPKLGAFVQLMLRRD